MTSCTLHASAPQLAIVCATTLPTRWLPTHCVSCITVRCLLAALRQQSIQQFCAIASRPGVDRWQWQSGQMLALSTVLCICLGIIGKKGRHVRMALAGICVYGCCNHHRYGNQAGKEQEWSSCVSPS